MRLIFIRHAEPDYSIDSLTEKGKREAMLLAKRTANWNVTDFFCSTMGRAKATAQPTLDVLGRTAEPLDWLQEFHIYHFDETAPHDMLWDFTPEFLNDNPDLFDPVKWHENEFCKSRNIKKYYDIVMNNFDDILARYGYIRNGLYYDSPKNRITTNHYMDYDGKTIEHMKDCKADDTTLVFFCHLGAMLNVVSHLINTSPYTMWQGFFVAPSSVTILNSEEREPGKAYFRCQTAGDTTHLHDGNEPISYYGYFAPPFQK